MKDKFDIFLSHNNKDKEVVEKIAEKIYEEYGITSWLDSWALIGGDNWDEKIIEGISKCNIFCIFLGKNGWGQYHEKEMNIAIEYKNNVNSDLRIIPVALKDFNIDLTVEYKDFFCKTHLVKFETNIYDNETIIRLVSAIKHEVPFPKGRPRLSTYTIHRDANRWKVSGTEKSILYRGDNLRKAHKLLVNSQSKIEEVSWEFIRESIQADKNRKKNTIIYTLLILLSFTLFSFYSYLQNEIASEQKLLATVAKANQFSNTANEYSTRKQWNSSFLFHSLSLNSFDTIKSRVGLQKSIYNLTKHYLQLTDHEHTITDMMFSEDDSYLVSSSGDKTVNKWDFKKAEFIKYKGLHSDGIVSIDIKNDIIHTASYDEAIKKWDINNGKPLKTIEINSIVNSMDFSYKKNRFVISTGAQFFYGEKAVSLYNIDDGKLIETIASDQDSSYKKASINKDGNIVAYIENGSSLTSKLVIYDMTTKEKNFFKSPTTQGINSLDISKKLNILAFSEGNILYIVNLNNLSILHKSTIHKDIISYIKFDNTGEYLSTGSDSGNVLLWNVNSLLERTQARIKPDNYKIINTGKRKITSLAFNSNSSLLSVATKNNNNIEIYRLDDKPINVNKEKHEIQDVKLINDNIYTASYNKNTIYIYKNNKIISRSTIDKHLVSLSLIDSTTVAFIDNENIYLYDVLNNRIEIIAENVLPSLNTIETSKSGNIVLVSNENKLIAYNYRTMKVITDITYQKPINSDGYSLVSNGEYIAYFSKEEEITLYNLSTKKDEKILSIDKDIISKISLSPTFNELLLLTFDGFLKFYSIDNNLLIDSINLHAKAPCIFYSDFEVDTKNSLLYITCSDKIFTIDFIVYSENIKKIYEDINKSSLKFKIKNNILFEKDKQELYTGKKSTKLFKNITEQTLIDVFMRPHD